MVKRRNHLDKKKMLDGDGQAVFFSQTSLLI